jgi:hypothetical protein
MSSKKSFVFYDSWGEVFEEMTDEEAGKMIKTMIIYHREKTVNNMPLTLRLAFALIKNQMDADREKYDDICEKRKQSGAKGGDAKEKKKQKVANAKFAKQNKQKVASVADNDNDNDNDDDINTLFESDYIAPTHKDITKYCAENNLKIDVDKFFAHYRSIGWKTVSGAPIEDWKALAQKWNAEDKAKIVACKKYTGRDTDYGDSIYADASALEV